jgi:hypothetical protein
MIFHINGAVTMTLEDYSGQIDLAFLVIGFSIIIVAILIYFGHQVPGFLLLILGIGAIIVGILKIIIGLYGYTEK